MNVFEEKEHKVENITNEKFPKKKNLLKLNYKEDIFKHFLLGGEETLKGGGECRQVDPSTCRRRGRRA